MSNLTFKSNGATQVALYKISYPNETTIQYSKNDGEWNDVQFGTFISLANNDTLAFSGNAKFSKDMQKRYCFRTSGQGTLIVSGELISLVSSNTIEDICEFNSLFSGCTNLVDASQLTLPSNTTKWCYTNMFFDCNQLTAAPTLVATTVKDWAYANMFVKCFSLSTTPTINGVNLSPHCYSNMFQSCINLQNSEALNSQKLNQWCYNAMFEGCNKLNASQQSQLPGESLSTGCYSSMYRFCYNTTDAPYLASETFADKCYNFMFDRTGKTSGVEVGFEQWPTNVATSCWLKDVAEEGIFICPSALETSVEYRNNHPTTTFPSSWNVMNYQTMPLTFRTKDSAKISLVKVGNPSTIPTLYYSKDYGKNWTRFNVNNIISLAKGEHISFSGTTETFTNINWNNTTDTAQFFRFSTSGTTSMRLYGNIMSLINNRTTINNSSIFACLFQGCSGISDARRLSLPATTLVQECYCNMFKDCINLVYGPQVLPAATAPQLAYDNMFRGCTNLKYSPHIKATSLGHSAFENMFRDCSNLQRIEVDFTSWSGDDQQSSDATYAWVQGVSNDDGTFIKPTALSTIYTHRVNGYYMYNWIPSGWTVVNK